MHQKTQEACMLHAAHGHSVSSLLSSELSLTHRLRALRRPHSADHASHTPKDLKHITYHSQCCNHTTLQRNTELFPSIRWRADHMSPMYPPITTPIIGAIHSACSQHRTHHIPSLQIPQSFPPLTTVKLFTSAVPCTLTFLTTRVTFP
jgi:hypothetical protein